MPMAYQVMLYGDTVTWRYPHPRTITKITVNPVPDIVSLLFMVTV